MSAPPETLKDLMQRFVDDRDSLDESELAKLVEQLREAPEMLQHLKDQLLLDESLRQQMAPNNASKFRQRIERQVADHAPILPSARGEPAGDGAQPTPHRDSPSGADNSSPAMDIKSLMQRFVDDRDMLSDDELSALAVGLGQAPDQLQKLKDQLVLDELLGQMMAVDRADFPAQLAQRLRDLERDDAELIQQVDAMRALAAQEFQPRPRRRNRWGWALAASALLACGLAAWYVVPGMNDRPQVTRVYGSATLIRHDSQAPLVAGERLSYGDRVLLQPNAFAVLTYRDGTEVNVTSQSLVQVSSRYRSGKILEINRGAVSSSVSPQPNRRPMRFLTPRADAKVVGTKLMLEVTGQSTRLNVERGAVELRGLSSDTSVVVKQRQFAVSDGGEADLHSLTWPSSRRNLVAMIDPQADSLPLAYELRGDTQWDQCIRFRNGSLVAPKNDAQQITAACQQSNELTVEVLLRCEDRRSPGQARIVSLSTDPFTRNFTLGQEHNHLVFRLRTESTGENGSNPQIKLCRILDQELHHVIVSFTSGRLTCYLDGQQVLQTDLITGDFKSWSDHYLTLGDEWSGGDRNHAWRGEIHGMAIYSRELKGDEALRNAAAIH